jgi:branched-chain amino acid transport system substrate-binding protein
MVHDVYLVQIKSPTESKDEWDLLKLVATLPGDQVIRSIADGRCPAMVR